MQKKLYAIIYLYANTIDHYFSRLSPGMFTNNRCFQICELGTYAYYPAAHTCVPTAEWLLQDFERLRWSDDPFHVDPLRSDALEGAYSVSFKLVLPLIIVVVFALISLEQEELYFDPVQYKHHQL